jgi:hypothetical protein
MLRRIRISASVTGTLLAVSAMLLVATSATAQDTLTVEVAETGSRFVPDPTVVDADGNPTRGNYFVTEGYIYESGTLTCADSACDGVVYDEAGVPSPEFPDAVLGTWTCYGVHTEDAATTTTGPIVVTTQIFDLGAGAGEDTIVTSGLEYIDVGLPISRVVVGGTGEYADAHGVQRQTLIGFNNTELVIDDVPFFGLAWTTDLPTS